MLVFTTLNLSQWSLDHVNIDGENPLYLTFNNVDGYIEYNSIEESNGHKYLIFAFTDKNKEVLEKYAKLREKIKNQIEIMVKNHLNIKKISWKVGLNQMI